ncbi:MAG: enoyl-CoA hydratase-related protein [Solirubrobacterales bacterium]
MDDTLKLKVSGPVATVTLSRPEAHNALDECLAGNLAQAFQKLSVADAVRVVLLESAGESFCAGADLGWMRRLAALDGADAQREAMMLAVVLDAIDRCAKPVIAVAQGAALGLGAGMVAAADMAIAADGASFALTEVRMGLVPSLSTPYLVAAMGARACRRYLLTGERFDAREAVRLGLLHGVFPADKLAAARDHLVDACLKGAPKAQADAKDMVRLVADTPAGPDLMRLAAARLASAAAAPEAGEGVAAALEKRKPAW